MVDHDAREALAGGEGWIVGGAMRDELLGRPVVDLDVACRDPEIAAGRSRGRAAAPVSALGAARGLAGRLEDGRTVDFTPLAAGSRTISRPATSRSTRSRAPSAEASSSIPSAGRRTSPRRPIRAVGNGVFEADPLRLLRAVRLEDELGFRCDDGTEELVRRDASLSARPAGERILGELDRLSARASAGSRSSGCSRRSAAPTGSSTGSSGDSSDSASSAPSATA